MIDLKPDYVDAKSGSMCWRIGDGIKLWLHLPEEKWQIATQLNEVLPEPVGRALALGYQSRERR